MEIKKISLTKDSLIREIKNTTYGYGVISGEDDGVFYPAIRVGYTDFSKTYLDSPCKSRSVAIETANEFIIPKYIVDLVDEDMTREYAKNKLKS